MCGHRPEAISTYRMSLPGPGTYTPTITKRKAPAYKIGTEPKVSSQLESKIIPGPGSYNPKSILKGTTPGWKYFRHLIIELDQENVLRFQGIPQVQDPDHISNLAEQVKDLNMISDPELQ